MTLQQALRQALPGCPTRKVSFGSKAEAAKRQIGSDRFKLYHYQCPLCGKWHLTKQLQWKGGRA